MKLKNLLTSALGLSCVALVDTPKLSKKPYQLKDNIAKQVLKDTREIREAREYKKHSEHQKKQYDETVVKVVDCFSGMSAPDKWDEEQTILDIHACGVQNNYPNILPLGKEWEEIHKQSLDKSVILRDITMTQKKFDNLNKASKVKLSESGAILEYSKPVTITHGSHSLNINQISLDKEPIINIFTSPTNDFTFINILRTPIIQAPCSEKNQCQWPEALQDYQELRPSAKTMTDHLNKLANKLLEGDFKDQKQAINLLLEYKILSSLPFSVESQLGTQFKNIVKMNYLTEAIKEKYPEKIDPNLNIPHIIDNQLVDDNNLLRTSEMAATLLSPQEFFRIQKIQIKQEFNKDSAA